MIVATGEDDRNDGGIKEGRTMTATTPRNCHTDRHNNEKDPASWRTNTDMPLHARSHIGRKADQLEHKLTRTVGNDESWQRVFGDGGEEAGDRYCDGRQLMCVVAVVLGAIAVCMTAFVVASDYCVVVAAEGSIVVRVTACVVASDCYVVAFIIHGVIVGCVTTGIVASE
jgi:hypothetical protein